MNDLLIVYNICQISGRENSFHYLRALNSILQQRSHECRSRRIVVSACMASDLTKRDLLSLDDRISLNSIEEPLPLFVTFNHTIMKCIETFGPFKCYLYVDSGIDFWNDLQAIDKLLALHESGPYAMTAAFPSNDDGHQWWGIQYDMSRPYIFPVGKATNLHCQIFSHDILQAYGRIMPDIMASDSGESLFSFMCAAIKKKYIIDTRIVLNHAHSLDGASSGFRGQLLFRTGRTMEERVRDGYKWGMGYEECKPELGMMHNPKCYDSEGYAIHPELKDYLRSNLFLTQDEFDYKTVRHVWTPGGKK